MTIKDVAKYITAKLFFPKTAIIDRPGIIISKTLTKIANYEIKERMSYFFEDILVNLQLETIKEIGREKTAELYYKIGRDMGMRHVLFTKSKKPPSFLVPSIIDYVFKSFIAGGYFIGDIVYNATEKSLIIIGKDSSICRKSGEGNFFEGVTSSILSFLLGENIEAEKSKCCKYDDYCEIIASPSIKNKNYIPDISELKPLENYASLNFPNQINVATNLRSFNDLMRFKKVKIDNLGKYHFDNKTIMPTEVGLFGLIAKYYLKIGQKYTLEKGIIKGAEKVAKDILKPEATIHDKLEKLKVILCAFGWGIPYYKLLDNGLNFNFVHPPITKYGFLYQALELNGFLNYIFDKNLSIKNIKSQSNPTNINIEYCYA